jgi:hypothetical protein
MSNKNIAYYAIKIKEEEEKISHPQSQHYIALLFEWETEHGNFPYKAPFLIRRET